ncbi:MAG TPA: NAD(P)/FAD-dependent oxidoreductase [Dehalococcoidia bacterium]|nr:NAD(P)/FAD-dependent oxidoreductase [Dehalococcoidia bacterium]
MTDVVSHKSVTAASDGTVDKYDALIIGAGLSGMYALHALRRLGMRARAFEAGTDVGGTWYWNRYPGARFDSESWTYGFSFDEEILREWSWSEHFAPQPETLRYCNFVADKLDLRADMTFGYRVASAIWDEAAREWEITSEEGQKARGRFLIAATGPLSAPVWPDIAGMDDFRGEAYHTARWPHEEVRFEGKRVAVIGTGATGIQAITEIARTAGQLTVFQRTPNWASPLRNSQITEEEQAQIKSTYKNIFDRCHSTFGEFIHEPDMRNALEVSEEEREAVFERLYAQPGFAIWMGNFRDLLIDEEANKTITAFITRKIRERVQDPAVADRLIPKDHGFGTKRLPLESGYYEVFNQENVSLVDLRETPIERITETGIQTSDAHREFDVIVYATGFDAITGALERIDFRGVGGLSLKDKWADGPRTYLGIAVAGFPNLLMLGGGPHSAISFCNMPRCIEQHGEWISNMIQYMSENGYERVEASTAAEDRWTAIVNEVATRFLFMRHESWMTGVNKNLPGKQIRRPMVFAGGAPRYREICEDVAAAGYRGFELQ